MKTSAQNRLQNHPPKPPLTSPITPARALQRRQCLRPLREPFFVPKKTASESDSDVRVVVVRKTFEH